MRIESIQQEYIEIDAEGALEPEVIVETRVIFCEVSSPCILSRLMIDALGRPGVNNDLELFNSGDRCIATWTQPQLSLEATQALLSRAIVPPG
jgi:hypothetical protein